MKKSFTILLFVFWGAFVFSTKTSCSKTSDEIIVSVYLGEKYSDLSLPVDSCYTDWHDAISEFMRQNVSDGYVPYFTVVNWDRSSEINCHPFNPSNFSLFKANIGFVELIFKKHGFSEHRQPKKKVGGSIRGPFARLLGQR